MVQALVPSHYALNIVFTVFSLSPQHSVLSTVLDRSSLAEPHQIFACEAEFVEIDFRVMLAELWREAAQFEGGGARPHEWPGVGDGNPEVWVCHLSKIVAGLELGVLDDIRGGGDRKEQNASLHRPLKQLGLRMAHEKPLDRRHDAIE